MTTKYQKAKHYARNMQLSQRQMRTRMREMEKEISELRAKAEAQAGVFLDAARYRRLQVLGAAPCYSKQLDLGTVLRFQGLDAFIDADMTAHASRGEVPLTSDVNAHAPMGVEPVVTRGVGDCSYQLDASISSLVDALNSAGIHTVASCSGHGNRPGNIALKDGSELFIAHDYGEARRIDAMFSVGANGEPAQAVSVPFDIGEYLSAYEWRAEDGGLSELTARDRHLLQDFANGLPLYTAPPAQAVSGNWEEAHKIIGRLMSSDPSFEDCTEATDFIRRMVADQSGPDGFATWKDAAIAERVKRVAAEKAQSVSVPAGWKLVPIKATPEMMEAGRDDALDQQCFEGFAMLDAKGVYDAMLAAAPEPPKP